MANSNDNFVTVIETEQVRSKKPHKHSDKTRHIHTGHEVGKDVVDGALKVRNYLRRWFPNTSSALLFGIIAGLFACFMTSIHIWRDLIILLFILIGVALGQAVDGNPRLINWVKKIMGTKRK